MSNPSCLSMVEKNRIFDVCCPWIFQRLFYRDCLLSIKLNSESYMFITYVFIWRWSSYKTLIIVNPEISWMILIFECDGDFSWIAIRIRVFQVCSSLLQELSDINVVHHNPKWNDTLTQFRIQANFLKFSQ